MNVHDATEITGVKSIRMQKNKYQQPRYCNLEERGGKERILLKSI